MSQFLSESTPMFEGFDESNSTPAPWKVKIFDHTNPDNKESDLVLQPNPNRFGVYLMLENLGFGLLCESEMRIFLDMYQTTISMIIYPSPYDNHEFPISLRNSIATSAQLEIHFGLETPNRQDQICVLGKTILLSKVFRDMKKVFINNELESILQSISLSHLHIWDTVSLILEYLQYDPLELVVKYRSLCTKVVEFLRRVLTRLKDNSLEEQDLDVLYMLGQLEEATRDKGLRPLLVFDPLSEFVDKVLRSFQVPEISEQTIDKLKALNPSIRDLKRLGAAVEVFAPWQDLAGFDDVIQELQIRYEATQSSLITIDFFDAQSPLFSENIDEREEFFASYNQSYADSLALRSLAEADWQDQVLSYLIEEINSYATAVLSALRESADMSLVQSWLANIDSLGSLIDSEEIKQQALEARENIIAVLDSGPAE